MRRSNVVCLIAILVSSCGGTIDPEFIPYLEEFRYEMQLRGYPSSFDTGLDLEFTDTPIESDTDRAGSPAAYCNGLTRSVIFHRSTWREKSETGRRMIFFHELGHCVLARAHSEEEPMSFSVHPKNSDGPIFDAQICRSLMDPYACMGTQVESSTECLWVDYLNELFLVIPIPRFRVRNCFELTFGELWD